MLLPVTLLLSCSPGDEVGQLRRLWTGRHALSVAEGLGPLYGLVLSDDGLVVVPSSAWQVHKESKHWFFSGSGTMICHVARRPRLPVTFSFLPDAATASRSFRAYLDGEEVTELLRTRPATSLQGGESPRGLELELPPGRLDPGTHRLTLRLESTTPTAAAAGAVRPETAAGVGARQAVFERLSYRYIGEPFALESAHVLRWQYLADLLSFGVTGSYDREKLGGLLFVGPQDLGVELTAASAQSPGRFVAKVQNSSQAPATFHVRARGNAFRATIEPHAKQVIDLELAPAARQLRLAVEGDEHGLFLWGTPTLQSREPTAARPPILLVTLDTTRRDALAPYGGDPELTPNLARLAGRATVYERAYATSPWTLPSHASIFTGLYPSRHGAGVSSDHLVARHVTLAERLRDQGYLTAGYVGGTLATYRFGLAQGFGLYLGPEGFETRGDVLTSHVEGLLRAVGSLPFFIFVNYFDPHFPYDPPPEVRSRLGLGAAPNPLPEAWARVLEGDGTAWRRVILGEAPAATPAVSSLLRSSYLAEVAFTDEQIGRLLDGLESSGRFDETLIVVTADHGELLGEGGYYSHTSRLDPELVEIPLIVKWPRQQEGHRVEAQVSLVDLFPTLLRVGRSPAPEHDGMLLSPRDHELGGALAKREAVYSEEHHSDAHPLFANMKHGDHAWTVQGRGFRQLVWAGESEGSRCLRRGPRGWEEQDCGDAARLTADELRERLGFVAGGPSEDRIALTREESAALRALGYL